MATIIINAHRIVSNAKSLKLLYKQALYKWSPWFTEKSIKLVPVKLRHNVIILERSIIHISVSRSEINKKHTSIPYDSGKLLGVPEYIK